MKIKGCWVFEPKIFHDDRGHFLEWFQDSTFREQTGTDFHIAQANYSVSKAGVIRGIHFAKNPPGQAKYVTCLTGSVFDVVVDLRRGSPTFGKWDSITIDSRNPMAVYIPSGIGHAFMALEEDSTFIYLCDQRYNPSNEFDISPFDKSIGIDWPKNIAAFLSSKDKNGSSFEELLEHYPEY